MSGEIEYKIVKSGTGSSWVVYEEGPQGKLLYCTLTNMISNGEQRKVLLGQRHCSRCRGTGQVVKTVKEICPKCEGTGNGPRGGRGTCKKCLGRGYVTIRVEGQLVNCPRCEGGGIEQVGRCDTLPNIVYSQLPFQVYYANRGISFNESLLGCGCVHSTVDYGRAWETKDPAKLVSEERKETWVQIIKVTRGKGQELDLCGHIGIFVNTGGYSVRAVFDLGEVTAEIASERGYEEGMIVGQLIAGRGGNGTLGAIYK